MNRIKKELERKKIPFEESFDGSMITIGHYPKELRVYMTDINYSSPDYPHTKSFYYVVSWNDWKKSTIVKTIHAYKLGEAIKAVMQAIDELGINGNTIQETLFF